MSTVDVAAGIPLRDGRILLGRRAPHRQTYPSCWDVIGGHAEPGETAAQTMVRELREEIGLTPSEFLEIAVLDFDAETEKQRLTIFVVTGWTGGEPALANDEHDRLEWFTIDEACALAGLAEPDYVALFRRLKT